MSKEKTKDKKDYEEVEAEVVEDAEDQVSKKETEDVTDEVEDLKNQVYRLSADFQNFRRRTEEEKIRTVQLANERLIESLLDVVDNFDRALQNADEEDSFVEGMRMIQKQFLEILEREGLKEIPSDNEEFDPNFHHCLLVEESDEVEPGMIIETLQKGYTLNDKVIRPSMVKVSK